MYVEPNTLKLNYYTERFIRTRLVGFASSCWNCAKVDHFRGKSENCAIHLFFCWNLTDATLIYNYSICNKYKFLLFWSHFFCNWNSMYGLDTRPQKKNFDYQTINLYLLSKFIKNFGIYRQIWIRDALYNNVLLLLFVSNSKLS